MSGNGGLCIARNDWIGSEHVKRLFWCRIWIENYW